MSVWAVGKPPEDMISFSAGKKNVLILPSIGKPHRDIKRREGDPFSGQRSLASQLAGGDVDGYVFALGCEPRRMQKIDLFIHSEETFSTFAKNLH